MNSPREASSPQGSLLSRWLDADPLRRRAVMHLVAAPERVYLVGGSVRDALLGRQGYDLDVAVAGDALALGRRLADALGGAYVPLDAVHNVARVVVRQEGVYHHIDLAGLRASDILDDLRARDFTINAMAATLQPTLGDLLDPTGGQGDLAAQTLRAAYAGAFLDDSLRVLRGVRLAGALALRWTPETESLAREALPALPAVSGERRRDELFNILALPRAAQAWAYPLAQEALRAALSALRDAALSPALQALSLLEARFPCSPEASPWQWLGRFQRALCGYWWEELSVGRQRLALLKLALLLTAHPQGEEAARQAAHELRLSRPEAAHLRAAVSAAPDGCALMTPLAVHRYYRARGEGGVNAALAALVRRLADAPSPQAEQAALRHAEVLLTAWFEQYETLVAPPPLLSGAEIIAWLGIAPGPQVSRLLDAQREAQVSGAVQNAAQARRYLARWMRQGETEKSCGADASVPCESVE